MSRPGRVEWIGARSARIRGEGSQAPTRFGPMRPLLAGEINAAGLVGDRYKRSDGDRAVTLFQFEHLDVLAKLLGQDTIAPEQLRRNIAISGLNVLSLKRERFCLGQVVLEGTGVCAPCTKMNETLGPGGFDAMRGHGGINARVIEGGSIAIGTELWRQA